MKVYLAGPMSGLPDHNYPAFHAAAARLRAAGHQVINPAELHPDMQQLGRTMPSVEVWQHCMGIDIPEAIKCDAVAVLPGWERSRGARLEVYIVARLGKPIVLESNLQPINGGVIALTKELLLESAVVVAAA